MKETLGSQPKRTASNSLGQNLTQQRLWLRIQHYEHAWKDVSSNDDVVLLAFVYSIDGPYRIEKRRERNQGQGKIVTYQHRPLAHKPLSGLESQVTLVTSPNSVKLSDPQGQWVMLQPAHQLGVISTRTKTGQRLSSGHQSNAHGLKLISSCQGSAQGRGQKSSCTPGRLPPALALRTCCM